VEKDVFFGGERSGSPPFSVPILEAIPVFFLHRFLFPACIFQLP
jgi:hypothetical protein